MADRFTDKQVEDLAEAVKGVSGTGASCGLADVIRVLQELADRDADPAFSQADVESIAAAVALLERPRESLPPWSATKSRGLFFVFEGLDRSGKSTQSRMLTKHLESAGDVKWMCFPNRATPSGILIDLYLRKKVELPDESIHQLFSANRWEIAQSIVDTLNRGTSIICDRYAFSGVAYTAAKGLDFSWCKVPDQGLPVPDGVFYLHVDEKVGASRANFGDERYENGDMQAKVRVEFRRDELRCGVEWHDVDGAREIGTIHAEICEAVEEIQKTDQENPLRPIRRLWMSPRL
mmetsp:Transcript_147575/g.256139  ORF Transcript_147575/g.256139 Transcript_147575/m.256139 type:complete len:292 (+) Transcript_147575:65-940(+)